MTDYYLKTIDEAAMQAALIEAGVAAEQDGQLLLAEGVNLDVIGLWHERTGGTDLEPVMTQVPGWHFNVRAAEPIAWPASVTVTEPVTPWRI